MAKTVKVPDPVYRRIKQQAESRDVTLGVVVRDWMQDADRLDELEGRR